MSRESLPTFDLYAELEVSRAASVTTIEAAYRSLVKRVHPDITGSDASDFIKRLNLAREWLTDPERRRRYDIATGPLPRRDVTFEPAPYPGSASGAPRTSIVPAGAAWPRSETPRGMARDPGSTGRKKADPARVRWLAVAGLGASSLTLTGVLALMLVSARPGVPPAAGGGATARGVDGGPAVAMSAPTPGLPSPAVVAMTTAPARLAELQASAAGTITRLRTAARTGDLATARLLLGDSAPHLRLSGLSRATFPSVAAADITMVPAGTGWIATAGPMTLTSNDGFQWLVDYGERPLAAYARTSEHAPFFLDPSRHELDVRVLSVVVTRSTVRVRLAWRYPTDASAALFAGGGLRVAALTFGARSQRLVGGPRLRLGGVGSSGTLVLSLAEIPSTSGTIDLEVIDGAGRSVDTVFKLQLA